MRISQDMALSGSGSDANRPIPTTLRPASPPGGDEGGVTDVEDLDEDRAPPPPYPTSTGTNALSVSDPRAGGGDDGGVTDTELFSENEDDPCCSTSRGSGDHPIPETSNEDMEKILRQYGNEGEVCIQDNSGGLVTVSRQILAKLSVSGGAGRANDPEDDALTDVEEMEGDGDFEVDIVDTDAPDFSPAAHGYYFVITPEMVDIGKDEVTITEKDPNAEQAHERKYSLVEFLQNQNEEPFTDVESLDSDSPRKLSVDPTYAYQARLPTPELAVDPMTDEESLDNDPVRRGSNLIPGGPRSITPSDCGDERLYENDTDEDEGLLNEGARRKKVSFGAGGGGLQVNDIDQGALTDCEDMQDSGDEGAYADEWKPVKSSAEIDHILKLNFSSAHTKISMKDQEPEEPYPETPTDDEEIHCKLIDSRALTPRLVIYNHKDQLAIESEDEGMGGGVTDVEDFTAADGDGEDSPSSFNPSESETDSKVLQDIMDANCSSVCVQESEVIENGADKSRSNSVFSVGQETETEDITADQVTVGGIKIPIPPSIPMIVIPEGSGDSNPNGGNVIRRRGKKKHAKRKRDAAQSQVGEEEPRSEKTPTVSAPSSPTSFYETVAPNICVSPSPGAHDDLFRSASRGSSSGAKSPSVIMDTKDGKASPIHAEIKLLVRTSENGRESVEIRSLREVVVLSQQTQSPSPVPPSHSPAPARSATPQSPTSRRDHHQHRQMLSSPSADSCSSKIFEEPSTSPDQGDRVDSPVVTQKLVVRFQEGSRDMCDVSASPSRVVESVGTFTERHKFWKEKDDEERKKRESVSSIEDYTQGFDNSAFAGVETIDTRTGIVSTSTAAPAQHRTPSPYEIERNKEAIFLDTDDPEQEEEVQLEDLVQYQVKQPETQQQQPPPLPPRSSTAVQPSPDRKVLFQGMSSSSERSISIDSEKQLKEQISREIFESELAEKIESLEPESKSLIQEHYEIRDDSDKSETETTEKLQSLVLAASAEERLEDVRQVASSLVSEIESTVERKLEGSEVHKPSAPSSVDITDEELMSVGDISSPEPQRSLKFEGSDRRESGTDFQPGSSVGGTETGTPDTHAVRSSSSGEFFTAHEENTIKSSSDEPSRPKSWDSSILGQVSNNFPPSHSGGSEYQTALGAGVASSSDSYLGSLSSDASASGTLVASQIDLGADLLGDDEEESEHAHIRTQVSVEGSTAGTEQSGGGVATRSIYCEIGSSEGIPPPGAGLPVTQTSSTSGTTVCTQVETTYEASVKGDPELADDQDGNIMIYEPIEPPQRPVRTHRRSESQSWGDSPLRYGIEERIEEEQLKDIVFQSEEDDIQDLFEPTDDIEDPIQRPITPEPQFSPEDHPRRMYYPDSSFEQEGILDEDDDVTDKRYEFSTEYERVIAPQQRLEDIEEESSVKNSPKSVMSLEMSCSLPELKEKNGGGSNGEKSGGRPGSRESSSSLKEFESLECAVLEEEVVRRDEPTLSEIEEGHESQVSEISEATEIYGQDSGELEEDKMKSSRQYETAEDASQMTDIQDLQLDIDPMMAFFSTTVGDTQTPDTTETSQIDDFRERSENVGTTDADSSLEFRVPGNAKMTSSGDSLDDEKTGKNIMEVSRDSLDFEKEGKDIPEEMVGSADSLTGSRRIVHDPSEEFQFEPISGRHEPQVKEGMSDSLELQPGQTLPGQMTESADSLNEGRSGADDRSSSGAGAAGGVMVTSSDSLEGQAIDPSASSNTSTTGDAAMWSSIGGGSASTLVSSQEDLTLENQ